MWRAAAANAMVDSPLEPPISSSRCALVHAARAQMNSAEGGSRFRWRSDCGRPRASCDSFSDHRPAIASRSDSVSTLPPPSRPSNTGDKLRSGARVHVGRRGHEAACPGRQPCRRKLRQLHPLVRRPRSFLQSVGLVARRCTSDTSRHAADFRSRPSTDADRRRPATCLVEPTLALEAT